MSRTILDSPKPLLNGPYNATQQALLREDAVPKRTPQSRGESFGQRLARLRKEAGYTQQELAEEIGISRRMMAYYEGQTEHPPAALLPMLSNALQVSLEMLLGTAPAMRRAKSTDSRLWRRFKQLEQLPSRERREVIKLLDVFLERERLKKTAASAGRD
jgi:transcriptional regulator with XRE-family HTH domain